jgi:cell division septation protein DedD
VGWKASKEPRPLRLGHLLWGLLCLFLMGWGFVLGLWVGQGSLATPEQIAGVRSWARYVPGLGKPAPESPQAPADKQAPVPPQLSFYTNLEKGEAPAPATLPVQVAVKPAEPPAPAKPPESPAPATAKPPETRPAPPAPLTFEPKPFVPNQPSARPGAPPPPARPPGSANAPAPPRPAPGASQTPPRGGRFTVQVASFKEEDQARELLAQLRGGGHPAYIVPVRLEGVGTRYRVRVGPFYDLDVAQGAAGRIRIQLTLAAYVTRED